MDTHAHDPVPVVSDRHQRGGAEQTEQLIPAIQKEVLQASRANAVLCEDGKGEVQGRNRRGDTSGELQGEVGCGVLLQANLQANLHPERSFPASPLIFQGAGVTYLGRVLFLINMDFLFFFFNATCHQCRRRKCHRDNHVIAGDLSFRKIGGHRLANLLLWTKMSF